MSVVRQADITDVDAIYQLAGMAGLGLTTLVQDKEKIAERIHNQTRDKLFVLEDLASGRVVGTSGIMANTADSSPFYHYKISKITRRCSALNITNHYQLLTLVNDLEGCAELCSLLIHPDFRKAYNGVILSRARLMYFAVFGAYYPERIIAEMRGVTDNNSQTPFWEAIGRHFFNMDFEQADKLCVQTNKQFIADLMPRQAIYTALLSPGAQTVIGQAHQATQAAVNILTREGFALADYIDIFDAGPVLMANQQQVRTINQAAQYTIADTTGLESTAQAYLVSTCEQTHFRLIKTPAQICKSQVYLTQSAIDALQIKLGDKVCLSPW